MKYFRIDFEDFKVIKDFILNPIKSIEYINLKGNRLSTEKIELIKKFYDSCVFSSDKIVKKIVSILKNLDIFENTYIIITSDHGEQLCDKLDHYFWEHHTYMSVYESVIKVPLIIFNSNFDKQIVTNQVELKDLFHTILHLTSLKNNKIKYLNINKSILYQIENKSTPEYIYGEYLKSKKDLIKLMNQHRNINRDMLPKISNNIYFLRHDKFKLINYIKKYYEFFDLSTDKHEQKNISNSDNKDFLKMKKNIKEIKQNIRNFKILEEITTKREKGLINKITNSLKLKNI